MESVQFGVGGEIFTFFFAGDLFTMSSGQSSGKRPLYEDLDAPEAMDPFNRVGSDLHTGSTPSSGSTRKKKKKNVSAHKKR